MAINSDKAALALMLVVVLVSACSPREMETTPIEVETPKGTVVCQLYTYDLVYWDRSIKRPDTMTTKEGDAICVEKGRDILNDRKN